MIVAKDIRKSFEQLVVLKGINLHVKKGEIVSIVGPSGAGKSTLLHILGTLDRADSGTIEIDGLPFSGLSEKKIAEFRNRHIGFIFQQHHLLPEFTALENVCLPAFIAGISKQEAESRAEKLFRLLGLSQRSHHLPDELSGGEQQRVAVARALINNPKVVFADEPSGNLDSTTAETLHHLFFDLQKQFEQTFVIVTHNEHLANMADRKLIMRDGEFVRS